MVRRCAAQNVERQQPYQKALFFSSRRYLIANNTERKTMCWVRHQSTYSSFFCFETFVAYRFEEEIPHISNLCLPFESLNMKEWFELNSYSLYWSHEKRIAMGSAPFIREWCKRRNYSHNWQLTIVASKSFVSFRDAAIIVTPCCQLWISWW